MPPCEPDFLHRALQPPQPIPLLVGLSGGLDSTVLLHALSRDKELRARGLRAVHVHHGLQAAADGFEQHCVCLLYTSDAADDMQCLDLGGCRIPK